MKISSVRRLFPIAREWNYQNHAYVSPLPLPVREAMNDFHVQHESNGSIFYPKWFQDVEKSRGVIGKLTNSSSNEIAFFDSTSHALSTVAQMIPLKKGDEVLLTDLEFPSNTFPWLNLRRKGIRINWCRSRNGILNSTDIESMISSRTKVISISSVCYYNGFALDLQSIAEVARKRGLILVVDAMQSLGALRIDVRKIDPDFLTSNSYKWLLGPFGIAFLHCRRDWIKKLQPPCVGWYSVKNIWSRQIQKLEFADTARRFETGHPNFSGICGSRAAAELLLRIGLKTIERRVLGLTERIRKALRAHDNIEVLTPEASKSGITLFRIDGKAPERVVEALLKKRIVVCPQRWRNGHGIKVSPHFYNTEDEVDAFVKAVGVLAK
jgi:cysteine desulfurase/selenocysteine lyase